VKVTQPGSADGADELDDALAGGIFQARPGVQDGDHRAGLGSDVSARTARFRGLFRNHGYPVARDAPLTSSGQVPAVNLVADDVTDSSRCFMSVNTRYELHG
jgi:hypothetical protein